MSGHSSVSWYQQAPGQVPQFLIQYDEMSERVRGNIPDRFSAQQFGNYSSELALSSLQLADSALYLCASSVATALRGSWLSVLKPPCRGLGGQRTREGACAEL